MTGSMLICLHTPSLPLNFGSEVFPAKPPWFVNQDLSFSRLWTSFRVFAEKSYPNNSILCAHNMFSWEPFHGIFAPTALWCSRTSLDKRCALITNTRRVWLPYQRSSLLKPLKPCFMLEMLMGFPTQSFLPDLKQWPFRVHYSCAITFLVLYWAL
jgi:hypothetical protein